MKFEKKLKLRLYTAIVCIAVGAVLINAGILGITANKAVYPFGAVIGVIGLVRLVQTWIITKNEESIHKCEITETDERNVMIMTKAKSLTFSIGIMLTAAAVIVLYALNMTLAASIAAYVICAFELIYIVCYHVISRQC